ncbi:MAG: 16S rRNA (uracil(1498)-N(3))-methyltransferase [Usitatibacteraceae bacterium]
MTSPRFFSVHAIPRPLVAGTTLDVGEAVARHLQVLRIAAGEIITLFDGAGGEFAAHVTHVGKRDAAVTLEAFDPVERESPLRITLVQALATADKMDFIVQKAVELGASEVVPISTARATLKLDGDRAEKRVLHWRGVAIAACEQCGRNRVPLVREVQTLDQWLRLRGDSVAVLLDPEADRTLLSAVDGTKPIALLIGPEGGFAAEEIARAIAAGVVPVKFGPRTLRTETAGMAAIASLATRFGDLGAV